MLEHDLKLRVKRLIAGDYRTTDFDRLFLGLRSSAGSNKYFRDLGDFVAHRDSRDQGVMTEFGRDVFISADIWSMKLRGLEPKIEDFLIAATANLRLATDKQVRAGCGVQRGRAKKILKSVNRKIASNKVLDEIETKVFQYLGNRFICRPAFSSEQLMIEFQEVLLRNGFVAKSDLSRLNDVNVFLSLYALSVMHGSAIKLKNGMQAKLFAGYANKDQILELKVDISFKYMEKDLMMPICLFLTGLKSEEYCDEGLIFTDCQVMFDQWNFPLEISDTVKLSRIS